MNGRGAAVCNSQTVLDIVSTLYPHCKATSIGIWKRYRHPQSSRKQHDWWFSPAKMIPSTNELACRKAKLDTAQVCGTRRDVLRTQEAPVFKLWGSNLGNNTWMMSPGQIVDSAGTLVHSF
jgi:hypothetical protein